MTNSPSSFKTAIVRGMTLKCPACGKGALYQRYLKILPSCAHCAQRLSHYPADDAPPYLTIFLVAHIVVPFFLALDRFYDLSLSLLLILSLPTTTLLMLVALPPIKGAVVGILYQLEKQNKESNPGEKNSTPP